MANPKKKQLPISDALRKRLPSLSRARRYQLIRVENGLCAKCGSEPIVSGELGTKCLIKQRERMRTKTGAKGRWKNSLSYAIEKLSDSDTTSGMGKNAVVAGRNLQAAKARR